LEHVACNLCGADDYELVYPSTLSGGASRETRGWGGEAGLKSSNPGLQSYACTNLGYGIHPPIVRCRRCSLVYANPRRADEAVHASYIEVVDELYLAERDGRVLTFQRHLEPIEAMLGPGDGRRLLDVGCHIGVFVEIASARGWNAWGVEPSRWAAEQARARGLQVVTGTLSDAGFEAGSFDVVTLWDVIEHLTDPASELRQIWQLLRPGGLIAVHTMDIESLLARLLGARWPWLMEMHLYYFSPATLSALLKRVNFQVISQRRQGRYLRLGYLASRLTPYSSTVARGLGNLFDQLGLSGQPVPINLGDLFTMYGRKPVGSSD
jgi:SAM-dependent methyltransferase